MRCEQQRSGGLAGVASSRMRISASEAGTATGRRRVGPGTRLTAGVIFVVLVVTMATALDLGHPAGAAVAVYPDVGADHPYGAAIAELSQRGYVSGFEDGSFGPDLPITRQQFAKILALSLRLTVSEADICSFPDVRPGGRGTLYPDNYVAALAARGIVHGREDGRFYPDEPLLRGQAAAMVARGVAVMTISLPAEVVPAPPGDPLQPWSVVTRGEAARLLADLPAAVEAPALPIDERSLEGMVRAAHGISPGEPLTGATVRVQATTISSTTGPDGRFVLRGLEPGIPVVLTAWASGYYIAGEEEVMPGTGDLQLLLHELPQTDNPDYDFLSAYGTDTDASTCQRCHAATTLGSPALPFDEWTSDAHASSARNERFLTMYAGTDVYGNSSPPTRYITDRDYGRRPLPPDLARPYYGPGYLLDFPDTTGNCAACHVPVAAIDNAYGIDPTTVTGVAAEGVGCDFCHKISGVRTDPATGLPYENAPGVLSFEFLRPAPGRQFFAGPLDDVAPGEDTYSALQLDSLYCASCHSAKFWGTPIYDSYGEWLASPYSDPDTGQTCQDCHMPARGATIFALPEAGGRERDPDTVRSHLMPGAADEALLQAAVSLDVSARRKPGRVLVDVTVVNDRTGHHVPSDSPLRQMILVVTATDDRAARLSQVEGPTLPSWTGVGDLSAGEYAGLAGRAYAKVLRETWTGVTPSGAYWNPTEIVADTRLPALASDTSAYTFAAPLAGPVEVRAVLLYRRAFIELARQKGWAVPDIVMAQTALILSEEP